MISPLTAVHRISKEDLKQDDMRQWIAEQLDAASRDWIPDKAKAFDQPDIDPEIRQTLALSPKEWTGIGVDRQDTLADAVYDYFAPYAESLFRNSSAGWLVLGGPTFQVLRWGAEQEHPTDTLLDEIQAHENVVPFFFARELEVDSINLDGGVPWPGTTKNPHYPGMKIRFDAGSGADYEFLFDTGADANYIDRNLADEERLPLGRPRSASRLGQPVRYRELNANVSLLDGLGSAYGGSSFRAVRNWFGSIGQGKNQRGLLSVLILFDLKTAVRLCGRTRTLKLDDRGEDE